ncbi:MAG TPA: FKBP-type peptidyl-prolyl cis-trans isomerase [Bacteroidaceae bacterium]|nr:FKBP-type peptidyl-prolyl cis-trans isomerase [Bacteroidaceae bacterium]
MAATYRDYQNYREENERWLIDNANEDGIMELPCGVQYKVILKGNGPIPKAKSMVKVHYRGETINGKEFDNSWKRKKPATFRVNEVIDGWQEALKVMPLGSRWMIYIPWELGYGKRGSGPIKAYSTLIFEVELLGVR